MSEAIKVNWELAPAWAQYAAMDSDDTWFWHEREPGLQFDGEWLDNTGGQWERAPDFGDDRPAIETLTKRPAAE